MLNLGKYMVERPKGYGLRRKTESPRRSTFAIRQKNPVLEHQKIEKFPIQVFSLFFVASDCARQHPKEALSEAL